MLGNLHAGYRHDHFSVAFLANNVFDSDFITFQNAEFNQALGGTERVVGVQVTGNF